jgi:Inner membrane component of T3SS, cytoplasmic domain
VSPLSLKLIQIGFLVLLWVLVLSVAAVMRSDLFARRRQRPGRAERSARARAQATRAVAIPASDASPAVAGSLGPGTAATATAAGAAAGVATGAAAPAGKQPKPSRPPRPKRGAPKVLVVTAGPREGTRIELGASSLSIGRAAENTLVLEDDYVSNRHARLFPHEGAWVVEDLGSTNGTYLDRTRLTVPMVVPVGTPVRIGKSVLELRK